MQMNASSIVNQKAEWEKLGVKLPAFDHAAMTAATKEHPIWVHFGAGNIFRGFIAALQQRLVEWGWLNVDDYTEGTLDDATIDAVIRIQQYMSERGVNYMICDPMDPVVDVATLQLMFDESLGMTFENPEM